VRLVITIEASDPSDVDWIRSRAVPAVEDAVEEARERLDGTVEVYWDTEES
jgi:hypothetical protein